MAQHSGMVEKQGLGIWLTHVFMILGVLIIFFPIWLAFVASTVTQADIIRPPMPIWPGDQFFINYKNAIFSGVNVPVGTMLINSLIMAIGIAVGKIIISLLSAFAIVYFRFPGRQTFFWMIFITLMLPVEVRIVLTFEVVAGFGMLNSYSGLIFPLIASATATFLFRQFFLTIPDELAEAARVDGARPMRFFIDIRCADEPHQHRRAFRDPVHLWLEPIPLAPADHDRPRDEHHCHGHQTDVSQRRRLCPLAHHYGHVHSGDGSARDRGRVDAKAFCARPG